MDTPLRGGSTHENDKRRLISNTLVYPHVQTPSYTGCSKIRETILQHPEERLLDDIEGQMCRTMSTKKSWNITRERSIKFIENVFKQESLDIVDESSTESAVALRSVIYPENGVLLKRSSRYLGLLFPPFIHNSNIFTIKLSVLLKLQVIFNLCPVLNL